MGTAVGARFEEIKAILDQTGDLPMGVCLDTAHTFEAGYDITTEEGLEATLAAVDRSVGLSRVHVLHVNDSKTPLGSRVDRHENIGHGKIGLAAFGRFAGIAGARVYPGDSDRRAGGRPAQRASVVGSGGRERAAGAQGGRRILDDEGKEKRKSINTENTENTEGTE
jgi:hypothetical protein